VIGWVVLWERVREVLLVGWRDGGLGFEKDPKRERWKEEMLGRVMEGVLGELMEVKREMKLVGKRELQKDSAKVTVLESCSATLLVVL
jgi:hypothetical protein